jgi:lipopolysaccharide/colanic/teichoic acid biosynthesis glycosyltransferase
VSKAYTLAASTSIPRISRWADFPFPDFQGIHLFFISKRFLDLVLAFSFIMVFLPFYLLLAVLTYVSSRGPVIYKQQRVGRNGQIFTMYKFRSMQPGAEGKIPLLAVPNDPRITKWGRFMRRYKLDETPQFFNVLEGSMSVVGPRPERAYFREKLMHLNPQIAELNGVKPGITSLGQIKFGYASNLRQMDKRARFDLLYLSNLSLITDVKIIAMTIAYVIQGNGSLSRVEK